VSAQESVSTAGSGDWAADAADEATQQRIDSAMVAAAAAEAAHELVERIRNGR